MWETRKFESRIQQALARDLGPTQGSDLFGQYTSARQVLLDDVLDEIRGSEPHLTDHGPKHVGNVLDNVEHLLAAEDKYFSAIELYVLGLCVLFHDVGNLDGREGHNQRIGKFYDKARPGPPERYGFEKRLVVSASKAHTGKNRKGNRDTLVDVTEDAHYQGHPVRLREIAAVVRFADELAEGQQRTSLLLQAEGRYDPDAKIYHRYASVTDIAIDPRLERIALTYYIVLESLSEGREEQLKLLTELLNYMYSRIAKLDEERKYGRFYSDLLLPFRYTSVQIDIVEDNDCLDLGLDPIVLSDKVVPEGKAGSLIAANPAYHPDEIVAKIKSATTSAETGHPTNAVEQPPQEVESGDLAQESRDRD